MYPERESLRFCDHCDSPISQEENRKWRGHCRLCARDELDSFIALLWSKYDTNDRKLLNDCFDGVGLDEPEKARLPE